MSATLTISVGQHSDRGRRAVNQDFYGVLVPREPLLTLKGVAAALSDGIGSSGVSQVASEFAVRGFIDDYYCTSEAWPVKKSVVRVLAATNSWLHSRNQHGEYRYDKDRGYVCTLSAVVIKSATAHVFHVGDARVYRMRGGAIERVTQEHRVRVADGRSHLSRAIGFNPQVEIDYLALPVEPGDAFVLATDGVHEHVDDRFLAQAVGGASGDLDAAARAIVDEAYRRGSEDNLTVQIVVVDALGPPRPEELHRRLSALPPPPLLDARQMLDGYRIVRELHASHRSHLYLATDCDSGALVALKTPSIDQQGDPACLERLLTEEWVARRMDSAHVAKAWPHVRERSRLYLVMEYIEGQTLAQWMIDHPRPDLETVRGIVEQIARGLQAFHRLEMVHQDLRPENVMIDRSGTVKIIDFGSTRVAGIAELEGIGAPALMLGTAQYAAPECFLGEAGTARSDLFSLGVIAYQMLSGRLPYGADVAKSRTLAAQRRLRYRSVLHEERDIPAWMDEVLEKAVHPDPVKRYAVPSEFVHALRHPSAAFLERKRPALADRDPVLFWKGVSAVLAALLFVLLFVRYAMP